MKENDQTKILEELALEIISSEKNLVTRSENWVKEHGGFYYHTLDRDTYESAATKLNLNLDDLQIEILKFEPGANLKPHHHGKSEGVLVQINLAGVAHETPRISRWFISDDEILRKDLLELGIILHVPSGCIHGFENSSERSVTLLSIQSLSTENDTNWYQV